jgi:hypothetical protein
MPSLGLKLRWDDSTIGNPIIRAKPCSPKLACREVQFRRLLKGSPTPLQPINSHNKRGNVKANIQNMLGMMCMVC